MTLLVESTGIALLYSLPQGALIGAMLFALLRVVPAAALRYRLAALALTVMLVLPLLTGLQHYRQRTVSPAATASAVPAAQAPAAASTPTLPNVVATPATFTPPPPATPRTEAGEIGSSPPPLKPFLPYLVLFWLVGCSLLSLRLLISLYISRRLKRQNTEAAPPELEARLLELCRRCGIGRKVTLRISHRVSVPMVIGSLRPVILLPLSPLSGLSVGQLELILAHELAHMKRHDYLVNLVQALAETLLFYHPVVYYLSNVLRCEREYLCDDLALSLCGGRVLDYAAALTTLERLRPRMVVAASGGSLLERLKRLAGEGRSETTPGLKGLSGLVSLALIGLVLVSNLPAQAQPPLEGIVLYGRNGAVLLEVPHVREFHNTSPEVRPVGYMVRDTLWRLRREGVLPDGAEMGLRVYTTIDLQAQAAAYSAVAQPFGTIANDGSNHLYLPPDAEAALVSLSPQGEILAIIGSSNADGHEFNRALMAFRQPGTSFLPVVYAAALEAGYTQADLITDEPLTFTQPGQPDWTPQNHDGVFRGQATLRQHLNSLRFLPAIELTDRLTTEVVMAYSRAVGYTSVQPYMSLSLGSFEVTPLQHAAAMAAFANGGIYHEPYAIRRIEDADGRVIYEQEAQARRVWSEETAYLTLDLLRGHIYDPGAFGARAALDEGRPTAGITGHTAQNRDLWFVGLTPEATTTVWLGYDNNQPFADTMPSGERITASRQPLYLWRQFTEAVLQGRPVMDFATPTGISFRQLDPLTGEASDSGVRMAFLD